MSNLEQPKRFNKISNGPNLCIEISYAKGAVHFVSLAPSSSNGMEWVFHSGEIDNEVENKVESWLKEYSQKKNSTVEVPLAMNFLPPFTQKALQKIFTIPLGEILSYGQVASLLGRPTAARAVGSACRTNPFPLFIPCHRVLDAKNRLRGYSAGGLTIKEILLSFEGVHNYQI